MALIRALSVRHGLEVWNVWAECFESVALIKRGDSDAGSRGLRAALSGLPEVGFHFHYTAFLAELAEGLGGAHQVAEASRSSREVLGDVYGRFTGCFDSADLRAASALLGVLAVDSER